MLIDSTERVTKGSSDAEELMDISVQLVDSTLEHPSSPHVEPEIDAPSRIPESNITIDDVFEKAVPLSETVANTTDVVRAKSTGGAETSISTFETSEESSSASLDMRSTVGQESKSGSLLDSVHTLGGEPRHSIVLEARRSRAGSGLEPKHTIGASSISLLSYSAFSLIEEMVSFFICRIHKMFSIYHI